MLRHEFDKYIQPDGEYIKGYQLREVLDDLRWGLQFTVEDLEAAYSELCLDEAAPEADLPKLINSAKITWFKFEEWVSSVGPYERCLNGSRSLSYLRPVPCSVNSMWITSPRKTR